MHRVWTIALLALSACGEPTWADDPEGPLPERLSEVGVYADPADLESLHPRAIAYAPVHPLWSNGSDKARALLLPDGAAIDNADREAWVVPEGALFFKTFSYEGRPIETRVIRRGATDEGEDEWEYAVYRWDEDGADATLMDDLSVATPVEVTAGGDTFEHEIPSLRQCRTCHEANDTVVIGFEEVQLAPALGDLDGRGVFAQAVPETPEAIAHPDPRTEEVLGYLQGNCVHCHNGIAGPASSFDMRHEVALDNLVGVMTGTSAAEAGIRVVPGDPESSVLFRSFTGMNELPMPPAGVQRRDAAAIEMFRAWIESLE